MKKEIDSKPINQKSQTRKLYQTRNNSDARSKFKKLSLTREKMKKKHKNNQNLQTFKLKRI